jgi:fucose permease
LLLLAYLAFISLGLPDTVLGVAWPSLTERFGIPPSAMGAVLGAGMIGYFLSGLWAGRAVGKLGVGGLLATSSTLVAAALLGYALAPAWRVFFPVGLLMGFGSGAIDSGLNGYAARHFSVRHVNWLHACWGVGASTGPALMTFTITNGLGYRAGYGVLAAVLGGMAGLFLLTRRRWSEPPEPPEPRAAPAPSSARVGAGAALARGRVWLLIVIFFLYTGLEASVGQWCFSWMRERRALSVEAAGAWTSAYWGSLTVGRLVLGLVVDRFGPDRLLRCASVGAVLGLVAFTSGGALLGGAGLLLLGMSLAPMFPTLMARTPARVGEDVAHHAVGFQVSAATLGSTSMPALAGVLATERGFDAIAGLVLVLGVALLSSHELLLQVTTRRVKPT